MHVVILRDREAALPLMAFLAAENISADVVELARARAIPRINLKLDPEKIVLISSANALRCLDETYLQSLKHVCRVLIAGSHTFKLAWGMGISGAKFVGDTSADLAAYICKNLSPQAFTYVCGAVTRLETVRLKTQGFDVSECPVYAYEPLAEARENLKSINFDCPDVCVLVSSRAVSQLICRYLKDSKTPVRCRFLCNSLDVRTDFQSLGIVANLSKLWDYEDVLQNLLSWENELRA